MEQKLIYNIEYAHIYGSQIGIDISIEEIRESVEKTKAIIKQLGNKSYTLCVLIDDYNEPMKKEEYEIYDLLKKLNLAPDYIARESRLVSAAETLLQELPPRFINFISEERIDFVSKSEDLHLWTQLSDTRSFKELLLL